MSTKYLFIARHAKSSWEDPFCGDFDRKLQPKGKRDAKLIGSLLAEAYKKPDVIVASPAKRTKKTAKIYELLWRYKKDFLTRDHELYHASIHTLVTVIEKTSEDANTLMLVGHNPGLTDLINMCWYPLENLPTSGVVVFIYEGETRGNFESKKCEFLAKYFPKEIVY